MTTVEERLSRIAPAPTVEERLGTLEEARAAFARSQENFNVSAASVQTARKLLERRAREVGESIPAFAWKDADSVAVPIGDRWILIRRHRDEEDPGTAYDYAIDELEPEQETTK